MPDTASILAIAQAEHGHALRAFSDHLLDTGWNEDCADCARLLAHVDRTARQVGLLTAGQPEEVPLF